MTALTFYAFINAKGTRIPIISIGRQPTDWLELKTLLTEVMKKVYVEHKQAEAEVTLERHLPGKFFVSFAQGRYSQQRIPYKREYEAFFKVRYNMKTDTIEVAQASFNYTLMHLAADFWEMEKGIRYRAPPLIPREHQNILENPKRILMEPSGTRYADYSKTPKKHYQHEDEKHPLPISYQAPQKRQYQPRRG